ncbi:MAG: EthD domain-containing protein [Pseudonocardia sp.]|uniref:EthD domain-containing protein n=1 Tax=Pseudonocardia sp. TaxID=60912 RepID=UPI001AC742E2|nr:EthD domain-containing protein [Pseudonocardia sp.]MBN9098671.1 EthD domain-containing protein [Pseudonocardia sp.]
MITRFGLAPRLPGLSVGTFQEHWRDRHGPLIGELPGLVRYWQNHALPDSLPWPGFDACSEFDAAGRCAFDAAFATEHYLDQGRADERRFVDRTRGGALYTRRIGQPVPLRPGCVRLLTFLRGDPEALASVLAEPGRGGAAEAVEAFVRLTDVPGVFDAVEALWFPDETTARAHLVSAAAERDRAALAGLVFGTERVLARVHVVRG